MSSAGPWSVKGIDPKAREIAKDLARRSGMTLGEWLNQMIIDGGEIEPPPAPPPYEGRSEVFKRPAAFSRSHPYYDEPETSDLARVTRALDALSSKLEAAEHRSTLAISGIDQSVMGVLARLEGGGSGPHASLDEVRATQTKLAERLRQMEQEEGPRVEAMRALEASLARVASQMHDGESRTRAGLDDLREDLTGVSRRLEEAESRTSAAVRALETSFAGLDARLERAASPVGEGMARRFEQLAAELSEKVETSRAEMAERMRLAAGGRFDGMEAAIRDLTAQVEANERQSAQAIDRMGREVLHVAQTLNRRVETVEQSSAAAVEQMGGEMTRIADAMEGRMRSVEAGQADALERLGREISSIAERLAERIAVSEQRSAQAIEEVGEQVARFNDTLSQRNERVTSDIGQRIRESEERTAKLLKDAQDKLDKRLQETQRRFAVDAAVAEAASAVAFEDEPEVEEAEILAPEPEVAEAIAQPDADEDAFVASTSQDDFSPSSFAAVEGFSPSRLAPSAFEQEAPKPAEPSQPQAAFEAAEVEPEVEAEVDPAAVEAPASDAPTVGDFVADDEEQLELAERAEPEAEPLAPTWAAAAAAAAAAGPVAEPPQPDPAAKASTRELIEAARAAARQASPDLRARRTFGPGVGAAETVEAVIPPPAAARGLAGLWPLGRRKKKDHSSTIRTALLASGTAAALVATTVGSYLLYAKEDPALVADATAPAPAPVAASPAAEESAAAEILAPALASAAPAETPVSPAIATPLVAQPAARTPAARVETAAPEALFAAAVRQLNSGDNTGVEALKRAANAGFGPAEFYLAKLYEAGAYGLKRDAVEARRWTERAAVGGDPKAMHNLGLYYFDGTGGAKNAVIAVSWFRRAAEQGLQDSQYNLARLYEQGYGVTQNLAEAYKWYLIAADNGDAESKVSAERLRVRLTPDAVATARRTANVFRSLTTQTAAR